MQHSSRFDFQHNYFQLFGLSERFALDKLELERQYRALQATVHPDKFAHLPAADQRLAMQQSTHVNEAYQTLRQPVNRARYLLSLHGVDTAEETNTKMPLDFLMSQMEWREALEDARQSYDLEAIEHLEGRLQHDSQQFEQALMQCIDQQHDYLAAAEWVRKLRFLEKLEDEIHAAYDAVDND